MTRFSLFLVSAGLPVAAALLLWASPAAQSQEFEALSDRIARLERELNTLQRQVYRGAPQPAAPSGAAGLQGGGIDSDTRFRADLEVRLSQLENAIRAATGRSEELTHAIGQFNARLDRLVADVDARLTALERGQRGGPLVQPMPGAQALPEAGTPPAPPLGADAGSRVGSGAGSGAGPGVPPRTLGTIPEGAVPSPAQPQTGDASPATPPALPEGSPETRYDYAFALVQKQDFAEAERALRAFLSAHPKHALAANAYYWLGRTYIVRKDYEQAVFTFAEGVQAFPNGPKTPDSLLNLGMAFGRLGKKTEACAAFSRLETRFPQAVPTFKSRLARERGQLGCP